MRGLTGAWEPKGPNSSRAGWPPPACPDVEKEGGEGGARSHYGPTAVLGWGGVGVRGNARTQTWTRCENLGASGHRLAFTAGGGD